MRYDEEYHRINIEIWRLMFLRRRLPLAPAETKLIACKPFVGSVILGYANLFVSPLPSLQDRRNTEERGLYATTTSYLTHPLNLLEKLES